MTTIIWNPPLVDYGYSELNDYDEQLQEVIRMIRNTLTGEVSKLTGSARLEKCDYLKNRLNRARQLLKSYQVEMRELPKDKTAPYEERAKHFDNELAKLQQDLNWAVTSAERDNTQPGKHVKNVDEMTGKEITSTALSIQEQSLQSTARTKQVIANTLQIGAETTDVLKQQSQQIQNVSSNVDEVESNLKRADKQMRAILRKLATDRVILVFIFLIVIGIVAAVVVSYLKPNDRLSQISRDIGRIFNTNPVNGTRTT
ncbi:hypothetical protein BKA69DRAFT_1124709 [Paraphysoderma sedebokerense]|nr:hypothetical protein BKA69DRAFT_1124709 [Paraphysoderma sedebokerense]